MDYQKFVDDQKAASVNATLDRIAQLEVEFAADPSRFEPTGDRYGECKNLHAGLRSSASTGGAYAAAVSRVEALMRGHN